MDLPGGMKSLCSGEKHVPDKARHPPSKPDVPGPHLRCVSVKAKIPQTANEFISDKDSHFLTTGQQVNSCKLNNHPSPQRPTVHFTAGVGWGGGVWCHQGGGAETWMKGWVPDAP